jgi:hypothetical protein
LFLSQTQPYDKDDAFSLLVQCVEALLSKESSEWEQSVVNHPRTGTVLEIQKSGLEDLLHNQDVGFEDATLPFGCEST